MKRSKPSGAFYRKQKELREQESKRSRGSLLKYFDGSESKDVRSESGHPIANDRTDVVHVGRVSHQTEVEDKIQREVVAPIPSDVIRDMTSEALFPSSNSGGELATEESDHNQLIDPGTSNHADQEASVTGEEELDPSLFGALQSPEI